MIPMLQMDYFKYQQMFRGNYIKGATLFRTLLNTPETRDYIMESVPALAAVFTDFSQNEATRLCYDILLKEPYFETAVMNYLKGIDLTEHDTMDELLRDTNNFFSVLQHFDGNAIFQNDKPMLQRGLKLLSSQKELAKRERCSLTLRPDMVDDINAVNGYIASENIYTSLSTYWNTIYNQTTDFSSTETYYAMSSLNYQWSVVSDEKKCFFLPFMLRTRVGTSSTYYYYPAVFRYDMVSKEWTLLYVASTDQKQTSTNNNSRIANGIAYDHRKNLLYVFYKAVYNSTTVYCDIINASTGTAVMSEIEVGTAGAYSNYAPYFCTFDEESGLAKYVWATGTVTISSSTSYGWLYGCSVGSNGLVWSDVACHPYKNFTGIYSGYISAMSVSYLRRYAKGAFVAVYGTSNSTSASKAVYIFIRSEGDKIVPHKIECPIYSNYSSVYSPAASVINDDGFAVMTYTDIVYDGGSTSVAVMIDVAAEVPKIVHTIKLSRSYSYTLYQEPYLNKIALIAGNDQNTQIVCGLDENGDAVVWQSPQVFGMFSSVILPSGGSRRYKFRYANSSTYYIYDYEGRYTQ